MIGNNSGLLCNTAGSVLGRLAVELSPSGDPTKIRRAGTSRRIFLSGITLWTYYFVAQPAPWRFRRIAAACCSDINMAPLAIDIARKGRKWCLERSPEQVRNIEQLRFEDFHPCCSRHFTKPFNFVYQRSARIWKWASGLHMKFNNRVLDLC